jgi:hypothetical protein
MTARRQVLHKHSLYGPSLLYYLFKMQWIGVLPEFRGVRRPCSVLSISLRISGPAGISSFCAGDFPGSLAVQV